MRAYHYCQVNALGILSESPCQQNLCVYHKSCLTHLLEGPWLVRFSKIAVWQISMRIVAYRGLSSFCMGASIGNVGRNAVRQCMDTPDFKRSVMSPASTLRSSGSSLSLSPEDLLKSGRGRGREWPCPKLMPKLAAFQRVPSMCMQQFKDVVHWDDQRRHQSLLKKCRYLKLTLCSPPLVTHAVAKAKTERGKNVFESDCKVQGYGRIAASGSYQLSQPSEGVQPIQVCTLQHARTPTTRI